MEKKLPMTEPIIKGYPRDANAVSILGRDEANLSLVLSNFIQLVSHREVSSLPKFNICFSDSFHFYKNCPLLDVHRIKKHFIRDKWGTMHAFIRDAIDNGYYVYLIINCFYISAYEEHRNRPHDLLIYGYDEASQQYDIADCFTDGIYAFKRCSFLELDHALLHMTEEDENFCDFNHSIELIMYLPQDVSFESHKVKYSLQAYLESRPLDNRSNDPDHVYGIDGFEVYQAYLNLLLEKPDMTVDLRPIHNFTEHKSVMSRRIEHMDRLGLLTNGSTLREDYAHVEQRVRIFRSMLIKYSIKKDGQMIRKITEELNVLKELESGVVSEVIHQL